MMIRNRKAQSMLEYIIVLTALVVAIAALARLVIGPSVRGGIDNASQTMENAANRF